MTPEEMERTMQFILNQQAQFAADIMQLKERQEKTSQAIDALVSLMGGIEHNLNSVIQSLNSSIVGLVGIVGQVVRTQERTEKNLDNLGQRVDRLVSALERRFSGDGQKPPDQT